MSVVGERFGPYTVFECLGAGGMATVHRASISIGAGVVRDVALKRLLPQLADDRQFNDDFIREAKLAAQLDHPNHNPSCPPELDSVILKALARDREDRWDMRSALDAIRRQFSESATDVAAWKHGLIVESRLAEGSIRQSSEPLVTQSLTINDRPTVSQQSVTTDDDEDTAVDSISRLDIDD